MTLLITDPLFFEHDTGPHVECADRLRSITARIDASGLAARCTPGTYQPLTEDEVAELHDRRVIDRARISAEEGGGWVDSDTFVSPASYRVALAAAGACASAVDAVVKGETKNALCLVRPPGHHATPRRSMGFCLFGNVALAAQRARHLGLDRILIVDWDVHHGNGTQDLFYDRADVTFLSMHRYGNFYPGSGAADETGTGAGLGATVNVPIRYGTSRPDIHAAFTSALEKTADRVKPQLVLISAGFDAHRLDPIGKLGLETEDFAELTRRVLAVAQTHADGRVVSCLEGGYNLAALAESVEVHLNELLHE